MRWSRSGGTTTELSPKPYSAPIACSGAHRGSGKNDDAIAELEAGLKLAPDDLGLKRDLADVYSQAGKYDLAEGQYRALLAESWARMSAMINRVLRTS